MVSDVLQEQRGGGGVYNTQTVKGFLGSRASVIELAGISELSAIVGILGSRCLSIR